MIKTIKLFCTISIIMLVSQQYTIAQIINQKKLTQAPFVSILQNSDNEYIYVGTENNPAQYANDVTLTGRDITGNILWKKNIEWTFDCTVMDAVLLADGSILIAGSARSSTYQSYPFIMKTDSKGDTLWTRYYENGHQAENVIGTDDGGYLFSYYSDGSGLVKLDSNGRMVWSKEVGDGKPYGLAETAEAVYLMVDNEGDNIVMSSIDSGGEILWKRIFGGDGVDQPSDVINASNEDDYLFAGRSYNSQSGDDFYIGLLDCFGYTNWTRTFGGQGTDLCFDLMQTSNGDFIAVGSSNSFNDQGKFDFYAIKIDTYGKLLWSKTLPSADNENFLATNVFETSYGSYLVVGQKLSNSKLTDETYLVEFIYPTQFELAFESSQQSLTSPPYVVHFSNNTTNAEYYDFVWDFGDGETLASNSQSVAHEYKADGKYKVKLIAYENDFGSVDSLVYKDYIHCEGISTSSQITESNRTQMLNIQPNPFSNNTVISFSNPDNDSYTLRIIDQNGKLVKEIDKIRGNSVVLARSNLPSGIYFVELSGKITRREKLLIM